MAFVTCECVYCPVRDEHLCKTQVNLRVNLTDLYCSRHDIVRNVVLMKCDVSDFGGEGGNHCHLYSNITFER